MFEGQDFGSGLVFMLKDSSLLVLCLLQVLWMMQEDAGSSLEVGLTTDQGIKVSELLKKGLADILRTDVR